MELNSKQNLILCEKCQSFFPLNIKDDKNKPLIDNINNINIITDNNLCSFCFNSLKENSFVSLLPKIEQQIKQYEYLNLNVQTQFSRLFPLFHCNLLSTLYPKNNIKINEKISQVIKSQIRIKFKDLFNPIFTKTLNTTLESKQNDMIVILSFDFKQNIFDIINNIFKNFQNEKYDLQIITPADDNTKLKKYIELLTTPINKDDNNSDEIKKLKNDFNTIFTLGKLCNELSVNYKIEMVPFYICGNYIKLDREIGQTEYSKDGIKLSLTSVDEELKKFLHKYFDNEPEELIFSAGGREDRDVRMLGSGRPFIYSVHNAKKHYSLAFKEINKILNENSKKVKVYNLMICDKKKYNQLKKSETEKIKIYTAFVWLQKKINEKIVNEINEVKNLKINQITPLRVLHKRSLKNREKLIYELKVRQIINSHFMLLDIKSSAGTYIKEFVNGDLGRTAPSLCDIVKGDCDIIQLDVLDIAI